MSTLETIQRKIVTLPQILSSLENRGGQRVVFTNGCFDLVHRGHIIYLSQARDLGDILVVGLNSDVSVQRLKGPKRPIVDEQSRALMLAAFEFVDYVILFDEDTPYNLISAIRPNLLVKGGDYKEEDIVGHDVVTANGGKVVTLSFVDGFSTTRTVHKIQDID